MKNFQIVKAKDGQKPVILAGHSYATKEEAVNELHNSIGASEAASRDAIYTTSDNPDILLTAGGHLSYSDILETPAITDDFIRIDVYTWGIQEIEVAEEEEDDDTVLTLTYDVHFNDGADSNNKGFSRTQEECQQYIADNNGTDNSYFKDYKGGTASVVCNETGEVVFEDVIK